MTRHLAILTENTRGGGGSCHEPMLLFYTLLCDVIKQCTTTKILMWYFSRRTIQFKSAWDDYLLIQPNQVANPAKPPGAQPGG